MKKLACVFAALGAIAVAVPSIANAETVVIKRGDHHHHWRGAHAEMRGPGWHHRHHDKVVIIKKHHHNYGY
ncbi:MULTISPECIES: hypothetical protein [Bradyrhizobium]|uniref:hypothetical protein n=1 Tax=Bradyrhizobium TaxID=374 RepID=UPI0004891932|nr:MULTISPECIES: hypothetical protein [Bradyrhizobium]MBO4226295.1 hypothetical protein [Bradyrhizobium neotropicale]RZN31387.1 hypothetical protein CWO90_17250 [Bradyrhizobium sp. Leo121]